jgi:hypothetical protein
MKPLRRPSEPPLFIDSFIAIRDAMDDVPDSARAMLTANHPGIVGRYRALRNAVVNGTLENTVPSAALGQIKDELQFAYIGRTKPLRELKKEIKKIQRSGVLAFCPMCKISLPRTFDHYLPIGTFPEFAVHPLNLVPSCQTCNGKKLEAWLDENGDRICLYFYSDRIPASDFVRCRLTPPARNGRNVGVTFALEKPRGLQQARWQTIVRHFNRLGLIERYNEIGNDELSEVLENARDYLDSGGPPSRVRNFIELGATRLASLHGFSYWRAELRRQVAMALDLMTWLRP